MKIDELKQQIKKLTEENKSLSKWDSKKAKKGRCSDCPYEDNEKLVIQVGSYGYCKKHYTKESGELNYSINSEIEKNKKKIEEFDNEINNEIKFQKTLEKVTRFKNNDLQELIKGLRSILKHKEDRYDYKFSEEDKKQGLKVLRVLEKIKPKSSKFIDKGVCINKNLFLAGTVDYGGYGRPDNNIVLTSFDEHERYNAVARVSLTIREAERLRSLLNDCLEHVRIIGWIKRIEEKMKIKLVDE